MYCENSWRFMLLALSKKKEKKKDKWNLFAILCAHTYYIVCQWGLDCVICTYMCCFHIHSCKYLCRHWHEHTDIWLQYYWGGPHGDCLLQTTWMWGLVMRAVKLSLGTKNPNQLIKNAPMISMHIVVSNTIHYFTLLFLPSMFAFYNWALRTSDRRSWRLSIIIHSFCLQFNWHPCSNLNWTRERLAKGLSKWLLAPAKESVNFPMSFTEVAIPGQVINSLIHSLILIQRT